MHQRERLVQLYADVVAALPATRLVREACASGAAPVPGPKGKLAVLGLGKVCAEMLDGAREAGLSIAEATLAVPPGVERALGGGVIDDAFLQPDGLSADGDCFVNGFAGFVRSAAISFSFLRFVA